MALMLPVAQIQAVEACEKPHRDRGGCIQLFQHLGASPKWAVALKAMTLHSNLRTCILMAEQCLLHRDYLLYQCYVYYSSEEYRHYLTCSSPNQRSDATF